MKRQENKKIYIYAPYLFCCYFDCLFVCLCVDDTDYNTDESYQARDYLAATMQFMTGHFACDVVWSTIIHVHPRLKMSPNMGVSRGKWHI